MWVKFSSVTQLCLTLQPHGLRHMRLLCPSPTPGACSNSCLSSWWCHPTISSSAVPFSSCRQSFPASGSFPVSQLFTSGGQSIGVSASPSVLPVNTQDWSPLGWTGWVSLQSKGVSGVFSSTTVHRCQFFGAQQSHTITILLRWWWGPWGLLTAALRGTVQGPQLQPQAVMRSLEPTSVAGCLRPSTRVSSSLLPSPWQHLSYSASEFDS